MKKNQLLTLAIAFGLFLSSCGSLSVSKMRYTRGLNIGVFATKDAKPEEVKAKKAEKKQTNKVAEVQSSEIVSNDIALEIKKIELSQQVQVDNKAALSDDKVVNKISNKIQKRIPELNKKVISLSQQTHLKDVNKTQNDSGVALIILILLAIIIPPLAVYLYFGEINTHFWISLILLLAFGGLYSSIGLIGLSFAAIHALLVVFGIFG